MRANDWVMTPETSDRPSVRAVVNSVRENSAGVVIVEVFTERGDTWTYRADAVRRVS